MLSKTKIKSRIKRKTNPEISETIQLCLKSKSKPWILIAKTLSSSRNKYSKINLEEIEKNTTAGDTVIVPGKILSQGNLTKKVRYINFSQENTKGNECHI